MSLEIKNPGFISKLTNTSGVPGTQLVDAADHIHSGLIEVLSQMSRGNYAIANATSSSDMGFKITQTTTSGTTGKTILTITSGKTFKDGEYTSISGATFTAGTTPATFDEPSSGVSYFLLVSDSSNTLQIRGSDTIIDKVPDYISGDTIITLIKMDQNDSNKENRYVQYLTTDKTSNSLSIGYETSDAYTEVCNIKGNADGIAITDNINTTDATLDGLNDKIYIKDATNNVLRTISPYDIAGLAPQGDITGVDLTGGTGIDITSETGTTSGNYSATIGVDVSDFMTNGVNDRVLTATGTDAINAEANMMFTGSALTVTGSIAASTSVTGTLVLVSDTTYIQTPLPVAIVSGAAGPGTAGQLTINNIQFLEVQVAPLNNYLLPDANPLGNGTTITIKNLSGEDAIITPAAGNVLEGSQVPLINPIAGISLAPSLILLPGLRTVTLASYADGGITFANPTLEFGGAPVFTGSVGWVILSIY